VTASLEHLVATGGLAVIFLTMILESCGIPVSAEIVAPLGGALAAQGKLSVAGVVVAATLGNVVGSLLAYWLAFRFGRPLILGPGRRVGLDERHLRLADRFFDRFAGWAVFVGRILPVVRTYISFPAGLARMHLGWFTALTTVGCAIWLGALTFAGFRLGEHWTDVEHVLGPFTIPFGLLVLAAIVGVYIAGRRWMDRRPADEAL
jgi:membrane protein DedA with SNARE-associated domain